MDNYRNVLHYAIKRFNKLAATAAVSLFGLTTAPSAVAVEILAPTSTVNGATMPELVREYMRWAIADPGFVVPSAPRIFNATNGSVAFAPVTTIVGTHTINFDLARGTPLLLSSLYWVDFRDNDQSTDGPPCDVAVDRFACAQQDLRTFINDAPRATLVLKINGVSYAVNEDGRFDSAGQPLVVNFSQDTAYGLPAGQ
jgi:hypothetical protein